MILLDNFSRIVGTQYLVIPSEASRRLLLTGDWQW